MLQYILKAYYNQYSVLAVYTANLVYHILQLSGYPAYILLAIFDNISIEMIYFQTKQLNIETNLHCRPYLSIDT